jgi:two-component system, LytTR family, response regulator LytT
MKTLLIDDEFLALNLLESFLVQIPDIEIIGKETSPLKALEILNKQTVDLLFLDVQMPTISGINLLKTLKNPPITILTTAYSEYSLEAFDLQVADYLLKPYSFERLLKGVQRAKELIKPPQIFTENIIQEHQNYIVIKTDGKLIKLPYNDILFIEGLGEYVQFICENRKYVVLQSLKNLEEILPAQFLRVHKSYLVSMTKVVSIEGNQLEIGKHKVSVSREKREMVIEKIFGNV